MGWEKGSDMGMDPCGDSSLVMDSSLDSGMEKGHGCGQGLRHRHVICNAKFGGSMAWSL